MSRVDDYRAKLSELSTWDEFLLAESGLPGPRGNIELAQAVADRGDKKTFLRYAGYEANRAPVNTPFEFLAFCGVVGLGRLVADGALDLVGELRRHASDSRWRIREAVAMALQRWGDVDVDGLVGEMKLWAGGSCLEQRAAAAAICEPRLLRDPVIATEVLHLLDTITQRAAHVTDRHDPAFRALRKGLGYCWSVATVADPGTGKALMEKWMGVADRDIRWIMKQNLRKARLTRMDADWVERCRKQLDS